MSASKPKTLMLMSGSIACYKACGLVSAMVKKGFDVKVAASSSALKFVGEATLEGLTGNPVHSDLWQHGSSMEHIHLERWADLIIAAPASAHFINRCANGVGDDLLTTLFLAHEFKKPFLMAPAMNTAMYLNPVTQKSIKQLKEWGITILEAASGVLACGETGYGKLLEPDLMLQEVENALKLPKQSHTPKVELKNKKVLVTAGGTREAIDDVRFITNASTGITGEKIARELSELGLDVTLALAETATAKASNELYKLYRFDSFQSLDALLKTKLETENYDLVIHAAAVSDFSVERHSGKMSSSEDIQITLKRNPKILDKLKNEAKNAKLIAFKLTSGVNEAEVNQKVQKVFESSNADLVVHNDISALKDRAGHKFTIFDRKSSTVVNGVTELVGQIFQKEIL